MRTASPRTLTKYQDEAHAQGITSSDVKVYALQRQGREQYEAELDRAHAAGWFDEKLYDSLEEAIAHRTAGYPEERDDSASASIAVSDEAYAPAA
jgi:hypothetical protein